MILLLALRNIFRSKKHSLVIVTLIGVITFLFFAGNSILARSSRALQQSYIESLTGDLIIEKQGEVTMNLFGANAPIIDEYFSIPVLPAYDTIFAQVSSMPEVAALAGQVSTKAVMEYMEERSPALISGVNGDEYFALFPAIVLEAGHFLRNGESGVMLTKDAVMRYGGKTGKQPEIGRLSGFFRTATRAAL